MPYPRRGEGPDFLERWGTPILFLIFCACIAGIYYLGRDFL